ncbi:IclR family transcriptional regulator [Planotetraspora silvatica]|uniref:IclR family transcriptional regulator n=1 Tax=Planotetraspora silvatica TaxID=234614 RepID=A0A8J3UHW7_9ACTN|nr:IclR family transcriptional regulator [Planotetraspora silvatica]GII44875.1 IclR family transcriptional regulator [Planotetraspora silvatica]
MAEESSSARAEGGGVQSVDRAISILEILSRRREAGVSEIALEIAVHKSTAFRLLGALEARGLVEQAEDRGKYRLSFGLVRLAGGVAARLDLTQQSRPVCRRLADEIGETVNLAVARSHYAVNLDQVRGPSAVTAHNWVGQLTPLHATSSGKVLLAHLDEQQRDELLGVSGLERYTPGTITSAEQLRSELDEARRRGYAVTVEEFEIGLNAIAAPIRSHDGEVVAAVSASGPAYRFSEKRMHALAPTLIAGADDISRRMGYGG